MYFTERNNSDTSTSFYYQSVADSMWITLLNLSGESPLWNYSIGGKIVTGLVGIFATGMCFSLSLSLSLSLETSPLFFSTVYIHNNNNDRMVRYPNRTFGSWI
jgi:hypothetical protein